jgi:hypothetical protein
MLQEDERGDKKLAGRFDLILASGKDRGLVIVIESKVKLDPQLPKQVATYRAALKDAEVRAAFQNFEENYVVTLTPALREVSSDAHLSWGQVHRLIIEHLDQNEEAREFSAFAGFLRLNHLSFMKAPPITQTVIKTFQQAAPFLAGAKEVFGRFSNDEVLKKFFRPLALSSPAVDFDDKASWYGVGQNQTDHWAYAGFFMKDDVAGLYADVQYSGNREADVENFGREGTQAIEEARRLFGTAPKDDGKTWLRFAHTVSSDETAEDYLRWFTTIFTVISNSFDARK